MSTPATHERSTGWFIIGAIATVVLLALVIYFLAFRYDVPLY